MTPRWYNNQPKCPPFPNWSSLCKLKVCSGPHYVVCLRTHTQQCFWSPVVNFGSCDSRTGRVSLHSLHSWPKANKASYWSWWVEWAPKRARVRGAYCLYPGGLRPYALIFDPPYLGSTARSIRGRWKIRSPPLRLKIQPMSFHFQSGELCGGVSRGCLCDPIPSAVLGVI